MKRQDGCESAASLRSSSATRAAERRKLLRNGVGYVDLVKIFRAALRGAVDDFCGDADGGGIARHLFEHDGARRDFGVITDLERAEHLRARADHHVAAEHGVPLAAVLAGTAERHALIDGAVIADLRSLADDDGAAVVNEDAFCRFFRAGVDFNPGQPAGDLTDRTGGKVFLPCRIMRRAVRQHGVQPG